MHAYTLPPTQLVYKHRIIDYKLGALLNTEQIPPSVRSKAFLGILGHTLATPLETALKSNGGMMTRHELAEACAMSKSSVAVKVEQLVSAGLVKRYVAHDGQRETYKYQSIAALSNIIHRADGQLARYCDCGRYVRFRRYKGTYVFNCRACGVRYFDDSPENKEMVK